MISELCIIMLPPMTSIFHISKKFLNIVSTLDCACRLFYILLAMPSLEACVYYSSKKANVLDQVHKTVCRAETALALDDSSELQIEELIYELRRFMVKEHETIPEREEPPSPPEHPYGGVQHDDQELYMRRRAEEELYMQRVFDELLQTHDENNRGDGSSGHDDQDELDEEADNDEALVEDESTSDDVGVDDEASKLLDESSETTSVATAASPEQQEVSTSQEESSADNSAKVLINGMDEEYDQIIATSLLYEHYGSFHALRMLLRDLCGALYAKKLDLLRKRMPQSGVEIGIYVNALNELNTVDDVELNQLESIPPSIDSEAYRDIFVARNMDPTLQQKPKNPVEWKKLFLDAWEIARCEKVFNSVPESEVRTGEFLSKVIQRKIADANYTLGMIFYIMVRQPEALFSKNFLKEVLSALSEESKNVLFPYVQVQTEGTFPPTLHWMRTWTHSNARDYFEGCIDAATLPFEQRARAIRCFVDDVTNNRSIHPRNGLTENSLQTEFDRDVVTYRQKLKAIRGLRFLAESNQLTPLERSMYGLKSCQIEGEVWHDQIESANEPDARERSNFLFKITRIPGVPQNLKRIALLQALQRTYRSSIDIVEEQQCLQIVQQEYAHRYVSCNNNFFPTMDAVEQDAMVTVTLVKHYCNDLSKQPLEFDCQSELKRLLGIATSPQLRRYLYIALGNYYQLAAKILAYESYKAALSLTLLEEVYGDKGKENKMKQVHEIVNMIINCVNNPEKTKISLNDFIEDLFLFCEHPCECHYCRFDHSNSSTNCSKRSIIMPLYRMLLNHHNMMLQDSHALKAVAQKILTTHQYDQSVCSEAEYSRACMIAGVTMPPVEAELEEPAQDMHRNKRRKLDDVDFSSAHYEDLLD